ncbi:MAG: zinc ribbon domain-containing protein [Propionibacteriaceae bacterium]|jgi:putative FmdB family regulatory protein|nr:zinc ribbon domain-containing protein [Propionibacteriaceae bacterium]
MPTYQYKCRECDADLEVVQSFSDEPLTICPQCRGELRKVYSAVGVVFKGSGFYATDSRSKDKTAAATPAASTAAETATSTETKPDEPVKADPKPSSDAAKPAAAAATG